MSFELIGQGRGDQSDVAAHPDGRTIGVVRPFRGVELLDVSGASRSTAWADPSLLVTSLHFLPDGARAVSNGFETSAWLWDLASGELIRDLVWRDAGGPTLDALSPDGAELVLTDELGNAALLDVESGALIRQWRALMPHLPLPAFHRPALGASSGTNLVTFGVDAGPSVVRVLETRTGRLVHEVAFEGRTGSTRAALSADERRLVASVSDGSGATLLVHDLADRTTQVLGTREGFVHRLVLHPDGRHALTSGAPDRAISVWDLVRPGVSAELVGPQRGGVGRGFALLPDGAAVVSATDDGFVCRWSLPSAASPVR